MEWIYVKIHTDKGSYTETLDMENNRTVQARCGCTGVEPDDAPHFIYDEETNTLDCECCHNRSQDFEVIETKKQYRERIRKQEEENMKKRPLKLVECTYDWETGLHYYTLNKRISEEDWKKVSKYFQYYNGHEFQDAEGDTKGWMTSQWDVAKVEQILGIKETTTIQEQEHERQNQIRKQKEQEKKAYKEAIHTMFKYSKPTQKTSLQELEKQAIIILDDPEYSFKENSIYGGGRKWIITEKEMIQITNNGHDGDDWSRNNITTGGAGAIGETIPRIAENEDIIKKYVKLYEEE